MDFFSSPHCYKGKFRKLCNLFCTKYLFTNLTVNLMRGLDVEFLCMSMLGSELLIGQFFLQTPIAA